MPTPTLTMKNVFKNKFRISKARFDSRRITAMIHVKSGSPLVNVLLRTLYPMGGRVSPNWARLSSIFARKVSLMTRKSGSKWTTIYLKTCSIMLQQAASGHYIPDLTGFGCRPSRSKSGLPRIIPAYHRKMIKKGNKLILRFWLTCFNLYREIDFPGKLKMKTITAISTESSRSRMIGGHLEAFKQLFGNLLDLPFESGSLFPIYQAGPTTVRIQGVYSTHPESVARSLSTLEMPEFSLIRDSLLTVARLTNNQTLLYLRGLMLPNVEAHTPVKFLGKLAIKEESAGKVRLFAMVDPWTQWALKPLHKRLFEMLKKLPTDGTFDQLAPLRRLPFGKNSIYSFDLSAATDRLPIWLQAEILTCFYGPSFSRAWQDLLVGRAYRTPASKDLLQKGIEIGKNFPKSVRYAVGQPMGALSSWAMLAMTHHYIVQYCAWTTGIVPTGKLFLDYGILGDDIFI